MTVLTPDGELVYQDASGGTASVSVHFTPGTTVAQGDASLQGLASLLASMTDAVLVRYRIIYRDKQPPGLALPGAPVVRSGAFLFAVDPPSPSGIITIPGIKSDVFLTDGPQAGYVIDASNSAVIAFVDGILAINATNPFGDALTALIIGQLFYRR